MKSIKIDRHGHPLQTCMKIKNIDNKNEYTAKVRNTRWATDEKPYQETDAKSALTSSEAHCVYDIPKRLGSGFYANLGVAAGRSLGCMAWGLKYNNHTGKVFGIDLFEWQARDGYYQPYSILNRLSPVKNYIELCKGSTHEWAHKLRFNQFKGIFIDADHHYENVKLDFELWGDLVVKGGEVAFHDTNKNTVDKVIQEIDLTKWTQTDHIYSIKVFKKL